MDFDGAIQAHVDWKLKLRGYLSRVDGSLKAAIAEKDSECALGRWIYGEGSKHSATKEYTELKATHARFHKTAADVIRKADEKDLPGAEALLGAGGEYAAVSNQVVSLIRQMRAKIQG